VLTEALQEPTPEESAANSIRLAPRAATAGEFAGVHLPVSIFLSLATTTAIPGRGQRLVYVFIATHPATMAASDAIL
jgi:hypothetical protein